MSEPAFVGAGSTPGLLLWRIEALKPVKVDNVTGSFYQGDSYILLSTSLKSGKLVWAIHFWLGSETSQDESGVAAYKSVELDDALGGAAQQYREVEGSESDLFQSYFKTKGGVKYVPGGVASGFTHVVRDVWETRLLQLKGKRTVRVKQVPLSGSSLNKGDVFILDAGLKIFIFNGPTSNKFERIKGIEVADSIDADERGGRAAIIHLDDDISNGEFWGPLGGFRDPNALPEGPADEAVPAKVAPTLFKISDAGGSVQTTPVTLEGGKLLKSQLESGDVFIVHGSSNKVFVWVGSGASAGEKREATARAVAYISQNGLPPSTPVERLSEGNETQTFKSEFAAWNPPISFGLAPKPSAAQQSPRTQVDIAALLARREVEDAPVDDGSGRVQVWFVNDFKLNPVEPSKYGQFYGGDSYVVRYDYVKSGKEQTILYFWLGRESSIDEKGSAALLTKELDDSLGGAATQIRVVQGKEPPHFRTLFKGRTIIHAGGKASSFNNVASVDTMDADGVGLFHVHGTNALNTVAVQVAEVAASLNSEDTFVLVNPTNAFVWKGNASNADEQAVATNIATILAADYQGKAGRSVVQVSEGSEPEEFWSTVGGRGEYAAVSPGTQAPQEPRLFQLSNATGNFAAEEIASFDQTDLIDEDIMLLDTYTTVFVWVGSQANETEKRGADEFAARYVAEANDGRDPDVPIIKVASAQEPSLFTNHFIGWDAQLAEKTKYVDPYQAKLDKLAAAKAAKEGSAPAPAPAPARAPAPAPVAAGGVYSYADLKAGVPAGVDPTKKEEYLSPAEFQSLFGEDKAAFSAKPKWKKDAKKKELGLF